MNTNNRLIDVVPARWQPLAAAMLMLILASGCATQSANLSKPEADPWEPINRKVYKFNDGIDRALIKPIAKGYDAIMPDAPQRGVRNFFHNLSYPVTFLNLILQGKFGDSVTATGRFLMNSTVGLLGFFDVASKNGIPKFDEDFGQTLAVWGWKDSRYLVLPFLGPTTVRDLGDKAENSLISPVSYLAREEKIYGPLILQLISTRAAFLPLDEDMVGAADPYVLMRDGYLQYREFRIYDGDPPVPDYDSLLEE